MSADIFLNGRVQLCCGDSIHFLRDQPDNRYDSCVTDPPYALVSIGKRFGADGAAAVKVPEGGSGAYARASAGFMGKRWDTGETAFSVEFWEQVFRTLKPGGHVVAFGGTRTYHRLACAIEDAGFEIRDQIGWCFGSGFPKSHNAGNGWGTALKPAWEPICLARKPLIGTVAANVLKHGTGAINVDGCRVDAGERPHIQRRNDKSLDGDVYGSGINGSRNLGTFTEGRWPANIIHDGSEEVVAAFPDRDGATSNGKNGVNEIYGGGWGKQEQEPGYNDRGSAARFFYQVAKDDRCDLCDANIAASRSPTESTRIENTVGGVVQGSLLPESAGTGHRSNGHAANAANPSPQCHQPKPSIARNDAAISDELKIVQNVSSAANLCGSCATGIAQEIVAASRKEPLGRSVSKCSIADSKKTILLCSLASYVESRENTDTILTTANLRELFGCVFHAIGESISSARAGSEASTRPAPKRLWYSSKADSDDRLGSKHPTVKPVDLMQWLVRLVTPKGGLVLDPFAGTGTTAEACFREGMRCVLIERETEYQADIRRRMALVMAGPDERARESIKAKNFAVDHGPLFAEAAE